MATKRSKTPGGKPGKSKYQTKVEARRKLALKHKLPGNTPLPIIKAKLAGEL